MPHFNYTNSFSLNLLWILILATIVFVYVVLVPRLSFSYLVFVLSKQTNDRFSLFVFVDDPEIR